MACLTQCSCYCSSSSSQPIKQHNLQYTWQNPVPHQHKATHQTYAAGCFICGVTVACDNNQLPLMIFMWPTHHNYMVECLWSRQNTDPVDHKESSSFEHPVPSDILKGGGVASVKSLTWQHLHCTAKVGKGHNWYERQRRSTQSMATVGLWR
jgi:hypothetical protein